MFICVCVCVLCNACISVLDIGGEIVQIIEVHVKGSLSEFDIFDLQLYVFSVKTFAMTSATLYFLCKDLCHGLCHMIFLV